MKNIINKSVNIDFGRILFCVFLFAGIFFLSYCFPNTCDDITFLAIPNSSIAELMRSALMQGNGRLFGNFFCYLIKFRIFTALERSIIWFGIILLAVKLVGSKNKILNTLIAGVLVYPCDTIFSQVYAWNSGFQNYAFPVFIILFDIWLMKIIANQKNKICKTVLLVLLFLSGLAGQFFSENTSFFAVCLAVVFLVLCIKYKTGSKSSVIAYLAATSLGFVTMMSYPHILGTNEKIASYRQYADSVSSLLSLAEKNFKLIAKDFTSYFFLWIAVSAAFIIIINKLQKQSANGGFLKILFSISKLIIIIYPFFSFFYSVIAKYSIAFLRWYFSFAVCALLTVYAASLLFAAVAFLLQKQTDYSEKIPVIMFILAGASVAPLLVVSPIGARTFYIIFVFMFLSCMKIIADNAELNKFSEKSVGYICTVILCGLLGVLAFSEMDNRYCMNARYSYLKQQINSGETEITLPLLPHQNLVHEDDNRNTWKNYIKRNYGKEVNFSFTDWNRWYAEYYKNPKS